MTDPELQRPKNQAQEFNDMVDAVAGYNSEFSLGRGMAGALMGVFQKEANILDIMSADKLPREAAERVLAERETNAANAEDKRDMAREVLELTNAPIWSELGLKLSPMRSNAAMLHEGQVQEFGPVRLQLEDGDQFADFLFSLDPGIMDDKLKENISKVISDFLTELADNVAKHTDGESVVETLASSEKLVSALEHLGYGTSPAAQRLLEYSQHSKKGDLTEFILGTRMQLFRKPADQQFGPAKWQGDATPEFLQDRWDEVIALLKKTKANPNGGDIFNQLLNGAKESLSAARTSWAELKGQSSIEGYGAGFEGIFNEVEAKLKELEGSD